MCSVSFSSFFHDNFEFKCVLFYMIVSEKAFFKITPVWISTRNNLLIVFYFVILIKSHINNTRMNWTRHTPRYSL